jgi:predicted ABC-type ATPase
MTVEILTAYLRAIKQALAKKKRPLALILAGHNGSGKSTLWYRHLAEQLQIPLINADRMMLSILPEVDKANALPAWAVQIRDHHESWMLVAQKGVEAFVAQAVEKKVPFAMETVFSHLKQDANGRVIESKIDKIHQLQKEGYFVLLLFVGLTSKDLSIARVKTRVSSMGHDVAEDKLIHRFPRTQKALKLALEEADATVLVDNSRRVEDAFTLCRAQIKKKILFDLRKNGAVPPEIKAWLDVVCPV